MAERVQKRSWRSTRKRILKHRDATKMIVVKDRTVRVTMIIAMAVAVLTIRDVDVVVIDTTTDVEMTMVEAIETGKTSKMAETMVKVRLFRY